MPANPFDQFDTPQTNDVGRPVILKGTPPQPKEVKSNFLVDPNTGTAAPIQGLPSDNRTWRMLTPKDPEFLPDRPGFKADNGDVKYGPTGETKNSTTGFGVNDYTGVLGDIARLRSQVAGLPDTAFGPGSHTVAQAPGLGDSSATMRALYNGISGKALREALVSTNQAMGGSGAASIDRTASGLQAMRASALHGLDPDMQTKGDFLKSLDQLQEDYTQRLAAAAKSQGGTLMRQIDQINGRPITPIEVPWDATDDQIRQAAKDAGYNVSPSSSVNKGFTGPVIAPQGNKTVIDMSGADGAQVQPATPPSSGGGIGDLATPAAWGSLYHGLADFLTAGLYKPVEALGATAAQEATGNTVPGDDVSDTYDRNLAAKNARDQRLYSQYPSEGWAGTLLGIPSLAAGFGKLAVRGAEEGAPAVARFANWLAPEGSSLTTQALRAPVLGAPLGAIEGAANAGKGHRGTGALVGGLVGGLGSAAAVPVMSGVGGLLGLVANRFNPEGAWNVFSHIAPEATPDAMRAAAAQARANGVEPAAIDTLNSASLDQVRNGVANRPGSKAATILNDELQARAAAAPARVAAQARTAIGQPPEAAVQVPGQAAAPKETRIDLGAKRDAQFAEAINPIRSQTVDLPTDTQAMLGGGDMGSVIRAARGYTTDPHERESLNALAAWADQSAKSGLAGNAPPIEIGAADALRQALNAAGSVKQADASHVAMRTAAADLTDSLETIPKYKEAMDAYRAQSAIASPSRNGSGDVSKFGADKGEALNLGENVIGANPEQMGIQARNLPPLDQPVEYSGHTPIAITPRQAAGEGVVRAVEMKGKDASGVKALGNQLLTDEQQRALNAILTPEQSQALANRVGAEANRLSAVEQATPGTAPPPNDEHAAVGAIATTMYHSPALKAAKSMSLLQKAKISPAQADRIANGLVNPAETEQIISQIEKAGYQRQRARQLYGMLALQLSSAASRRATAK